MLRELHVSECDHPYLPPGSSMSTQVAQKILNKLRGLTSNEAMSLSQWYHWTLPAQTTNELALLRRISTANVATNPSTQHDTTLFHMGFEAVLAITARDLVRNGGQHHERERGGPPLGMLLKMRQDLPRSSRDGTSFILNFGATSNASAFPSTS